MASVNDIKYVVFGVQFSRSFKLLDSWGEIADDILYKTEYFDSDFFTNISTQYTTERNLHNPMTGNFLALSSNSLVFKYYIPNGDNFEKEYEYFTERVNKYLVEKILTKYNLVIRRIGTVFACQFNNKELDEFSKKYDKMNIGRCFDVIYLLSKMFNMSKSKKIFIRKSSIIYSKRYR